MFKLTPLNSARILQAWSPDDLRLQIDVRLSVDETSQHAPNGKVPTRLEMQKLAGSIYDARRKRDKMIAEEFFGEPAWDMLLALYCLPARGETMCVTSLSYAANVPPTTGLRVQGVLVERGLVERVPQVSDGRRLIVALTETGERILEKYLMSLLDPARTQNAFAEIAVR